MSEDRMTFGPGVLGTFATDGTLLPHPEARVVEAEDFEQMMNAVERAYSVAVSLAIRSRSF